MSKQAAFQCKYNANKVWIVKRSRFGHFFITQELCGERLYAFQRVPQCVILSILEITKSQLKQGLSKGIQ